MALAATARRAAGRAALGPATRCFSIVVCMLSMGWRLNACLPKLVGSLPQTEEQTPTPNETE